MSAALVADSASQVAPVLEALDARWPPWLTGDRVRVLDGNHLAKTERRLQELQHTWAAALPGKVLAVYDQELDLVTQVFLTPDGRCPDAGCFTAAGQGGRSRGCQSLEKD